jgi:hypothetical protein
MTCLTISCISLGVIVIVLMIVTMTMKLIWVAVKGSARADKTSVAGDTDAAESDANVITVNTTVEGISENGYHVVDKKPWWYALVGSLVLV